MRHCRRPPYPGSYRLLRRRKPSQPFSVAPTGSDEVTEDHAPRGAVGGWQGPRRGLGCVTSCVRTWSGRPGSPRHCRDGQPSSRGRRVPRRGSAVTDRPDESLHPPSATRCVSRPHGVCGRSPHKAEARRPRYDLRHVEKHLDYRDERRAAGRSGVTPKAGFDNEFWPTCDTEFGPPPLLDDVPASDVASGVVAVYLSAQDFALR